MGAAHKAAPGRVGFTAEALWPSSSPSKAVVDPPLHSMPHCHIGTTHPAP